MSFENWPYTNFHDLNLDWVLGEVKKLLASNKTLQAAVDNIMERVEPAVAAELKRLYDSGELSKMFGSVTPEIFGAVGDGVTDDSAAIQAALNTGLAVDFSARKYAVGTMLMANDYYINGNGAELVAINNMNYVITLSTSSTDVVHPGNYYITNITINAAYKADGIHRTGNRGQLISNCNICNVSGVGLRDDAGECNIETAKIYQTYTNKANLPTNSVGVIVSNDSIYSGIAITDFVTGFLCERGGFTINNSTMWLSQDALWNVSKGAIVKTENSRFENVVFDTLKTGISIEKNYCFVLANNISWLFNRNVVSDISSATLVNSIANQFRIRIVGLLGDVHGAALKLVGDSVYSAWKNNTNFPNTVPSISDAILQNATNITNNILFDCPIDNFVSTVNGATVQTSRVYRTGATLTGYVRLRLTAANWTAVSATFSVPPVVPISPVCNTIAQYFNSITQCVGTINTNGVFGITGDNSNMWCDIMIQYPYYKG